MRYFMLATIVFLLAACGDDNPAVENTNSVVFQNIDIVSKGNEFVLTGEVIAAEGEFFYIIEQGDKQIFEERRISAPQESGDWGKFEIKEQLSNAMIESNDPPILMLYGKNKDGEIVNPNYIPVDIKKE
ncbi:hypothetical protein NSQ77_03275 [Oceanobacillus sp. FSL K6-2867]|uniref:hypothetical protein n=1 Tax=Oceanobacillus sp. FSL K6-2867 TaxID=2954748 RepID=UPI0030D918D7